MILKSKFKVSQVCDMLPLSDKLYKQSREGVVFNNLYDLILKEENILLAFQNVQHNASPDSKGVDGKTWRDYQKLTTLELVRRIRRRLADFKPMPVNRIYIRKENGDKRTLGILTIEDRIIQQCIKQVIEPICEAKFHPASFGYRPLRSTKYALAKMEMLMEVMQYPYCVVVDIKDFFDNIDHEILAKQIMAMGIRDRRLNAILAKMMKPEIKGVGVQRKGLVQGGVLSPLLSNIVLNDFDWWMQSQCRGKDFKALTQDRFYMVRYADDFKILCSNYADACKVYRATEKWLKETLGLSVSRLKSKIVDMRSEAIDFLGFELSMEMDDEKKYCVEVDVSAKNREKMLRMLEALLSHERPGNKERVLQEMNKRITGMQRYYQSATNAEAVFRGLEARLMPLMEKNFQEVAKLVAFRESGRQYMEKMQVYRDDYMTYKIGKTVLVPISCIAYQRPVLFPYEYNIYTKEGRREFIMKNKSKKKNSLKRLSVKPKVEKKDTGVFARLKGFFSL